MQIINTNNNFPSFQGKQHVGRVMQEAANLKGIYSQYKIKPKRGHAVLLLDKMRSKRGGQQAFDTYISSLSRTEVQDLLVTARQKLRSALLKIAPVDVSKLPPHQRDVAAQKAQKLEKHIKILSKQVRVKN